MNRAELLRHSEAIKQKREQDQPGWLVLPSQLVSAGDACWSRELAPELYQTELAALRAAWHHAKAGHLVELYPDPDVDEWGRPR